MKAITTGHGNFCNYVRNDNKIGLKTTLWRYFHLSKQTPIDLVDTSRHDSLQEVLDDDNLRFHSSPKESLVSDLLKTSIDPLMDTYVRDSIKLYQ